MPRPSPSVCRCEAARLTALVLHIPRHRSAPDADPCPLSMVLPHRLAPTFGRDSLPTSARQMRGVRPASWKNGLPLGRRALVGSREEAVARRTRQTTAAATRAVAVEGDYPVDARGPRLLASRSRPNEQPALKPEGVLPTLSHAARPPGASAPALDDLVPAQSTRRPLPGSVSVAGKRTRHLKSGRGRRTKRDLT